MQADISFFDSLLCCPGSVSCFNSSSRRFVVRRVENVGTSRLRGSISNYWRHAVPEKRAMASFRGNPNKNTVRARERQRDKADDEMAYEMFYEQCMNDPRLCEQLAAEGWTGETLSKFFSDNGIAKLEQEKLEREQEQMRQRPAA